MSKSKRNTNTQEEPAEAADTDLEATTAVADEPQTSSNANRKARKQAKVESAAASVNVIRSAMLQQSITAARKEFGDKNICAAGDANRIVVGLPLPGLAMEYLIQNTVWPLGRFTQIVGKHGSCKSALCFEMVRWFKESSGISYLFENETKYSPDLALSIIGYPKTPEDEVFVHLPCTSVDDWQSKLQMMVKWCKEQMAKKEIGRKFPVLYLVDSLMGKLSIESQKTIEKNGHADRAHPHEALMINGFLKKIPQELEEWPMCLVATNHLKPKKAENGAHMERIMPGGATPGFQETFEIEMRKDASSKLTYVDEDNFETGGLKLVLICTKNSLGETGRSIKAQIHWKQEYVEEADEYRQVSAWDWPAATVDLLMSFEGHRQQKVQEVVHIGGTGNKLYSKTFGISSSDPISRHDLGVLIEGDAEIKTRLRRLFGIKERKLFIPGIDYSKQLEALIKAAERNMTR